MNTDEKRKDFREAAPDFTKKRKEFFTEGNEVNRGERRRGKRRGNRRKKISTGVFMNPARLAGNHA